MGQAKRRGNQQERIEQAKARLDAIRPKVLVCDACKTEITDIKDVPTRGMKGIDGIFLGTCPSCGQTTQAVAGETEAVQAFTAYMDEHFRQSQHQHAPKLPRIKLQGGASKDKADHAVASSEQEVRSAHAISDDATLIGYVVRLTDSGQYLAQAGAEAKYSANLATAQVYSSHVKALKASKLVVAASEVALLFDQDASLAAYSASRVH